MKTMIRDYVGTAKQLKAILNLNPEIDQINSYQAETMEMVMDSVMDSEPCDVERDLRDEYMDNVESDGDKWGEPNNE